MAWLVDARKLKPGPYTGTFGPIWPAKFAPPAVSGLVALKVMAPVFGFTAWTRPDTSVTIHRSEPRRTWSLTTRLIWLAFAAAMSAARRTENLLDVVTRASRSWPHRPGLMALTVSAGETAPPLGRVPVNGRDAGAAWIEAAISGSL